MLLTEFLNKSDFSKQTEFRRSLLITYFNLKKGHATSFSPVQIADSLHALGYARPNLSRLRNAIKKSKVFVAAGGIDQYKIHPASLEALDTEFPALTTKSEEIISYDSVLPEALLQKERGFIRSLIKQINSSYENNIFDGCAVLMRRLMEILLILSYEELKIESCIRNGNGDYKPLEAIITDAVGNSTLRLSRNSKEYLPIFRKLGNFSAHKIFYNADRKLIESNIIDFRATAEELLYKAGLRT